ncbi:MAG: aminomethyltransferase beta-barrel domain-containing protein [Lysobacteraceae bacterium]
MSPAGRILLGVSGGVDSSVAAWRLRESGADVTGLFMQNWQDDGSGECRAEDDRRDALRVCGQLGLPFLARDFSADYWSGVFEPFLAEYRAGRTPNPDAPWFVVGKDVERNRLIVDQGDSPLLISRRLRSEPMHWIAGEAPPFPLRCEAQVRYRQPPQACTVRPAGDGIAVVFDQPQRAVTPGQSVVLYLGEACLGGAVIAATDAALDPNRLPDE